MKIGLEKEFFVLKDGQPTVVPVSLSADESGVLAEARSAAFDNPTDAVFSLLADFYKLTEQANKLNLTLSDSPVMKIDRKTKIDASRIYAKPITKHRNLYGFEHHGNRISEQTAGVHISFTDEGTVYQKENQPPIKYNRMFDYVRIFKGLDKAFAQEIKDAKRKPGFYELKDDGRIEYRSLPANVNLSKVIEVLNNLI